jgi:hypothetical protein
MEEDFADIWAEFDAIRIASENSISKPKKRYQHECMCGGVQVINSDNLPTCTRCGVVESMWVDDSPEWRNGVSEDGVSKDASRCGNLASDTELYSTQWGTGTVINTYNNQAYAMRRMARINFHVSMNHKDRALFHAYKDIEKAARDVLSLNEMIIRDAKVLYKNFNKAKLTRGAIRTGIKANCVLYACKLSNIPRTTKEIADAFNIQSRDVSRTAQIFRETILGKVSETQSVTRSVDVVHRLLNSFNPDQPTRMKCIKLCKKLDDCTTLMSKTPSSIASVVILLALDATTTRQEVCDKCDISLPTLSKIEKLARVYLEDTCV